MIDCRTARIEIAGTGPDELREELKAHVGGCPACSRFRDETLALARISATMARPYTVPDAVAVLQRAESMGSPGRGGWWIAPLLSAGATAAGLILFFGISPAPPTDAGEAAGVGHRIEANVTAGDAVTWSEEIDLPATLGAVNDYLVIGKVEEESRHE